MSASLPRSTPSAQGVAAAGVERFLDAVAADDLELHSLMVLRHGCVVAEGWWSPYEADGLQLLYSLSKSFTATAVGLAQAEGLLSVHDRVLDLLADDAPVEPDPFLQELRVRDLLAMASGHRDDTLSRVDRRDPVRGLLALPAEEAPGTWFTYNNGASVLLAAVVQAATRSRLLDYLGPRLLEPLGIPRACWLGIGDLDQGYSGLHLATEAVAKLGLLYLQRGLWAGRQLLPEDWVAAATRRQVDNPREPEPDWRRGYGYQFWMARHGYRGDGAYGQFCLVLPEADAVVVMTGATERMQAVLDHVWAHLWPALSAGGDDGDARLATRLAGLCLPPATGSRDRPVGQASASSRPAGDLSPQADPLRVLEVVEIPDGWSLRLADADGALEVRCGHQTWLPTTVELPGGRLLEVAGSAAWTSPTTLVAHLLFVRTPHRLVVHVDETAGPALHWHTAPLDFTSLRGLALPADRMWTATAAGEG
ncbi:MAG: serine hydrolase domain-containing protein [Actinomycetes bacterium]